MILLDQERLRAAYCTRLVALQDELEQLPFRTLLEEHARFAGIGEALVGDGELWGSVPADWAAMKRDLAEVKNRILSALMPGTTLTVEEGSARPYEEHLAEAVRQRRYVKDARADLQRALRSLVALPLADGTFVSSELLLLSVTELRGMTELDKVSSLPESEALRCFRDDGTLTDVLVRGRRRELCLKMATGRRSLGSTRRAAFQFTAPIGNDKGVYLGNVRMVIDAAGYMTARKWLIAIIGGGAILAAFVVGMLVHAMVRSVERRLRAAYVDVTAIASGEIARIVEPRGDDEVGLLVFEIGRLRDAGRAIPPDEKPGGEQDPKEEDGVAS